MKAVEAAAQEVLDGRAAFPGSSLADLYDPLTMPPRLVNAHQHLDRAVDLCYRPQPFPTETKRMEYLFELYDRYTAGLFVKEKKGKRKKVGGASKSDGNVVEKAFSDEGPAKLSSPVCYVGSSGLREGFSEER